MDILDRLRYVEGRLDALNAVRDRIPDDVLCIFCLSKEYSGNGIVHDEKCPIRILREIIQVLKGDDYAKM